jgi:hypothetical protein
MTRYEIKFKDNIQHSKGYALNIMNVPISQIYEEFHLDNDIIVTIDPDWTEEDFATLIDFDDYLWLFPLSRKSAVIKELQNLGKL